MVNEEHERGQVFVDLDRLSRRAEHEARDAFAKTETPPGMRGSIGRILMLIPDEGARLTSLAAGAWITPQSLGQRIREMEELGWVTTRTDPDDGRARLVQRTPQGTDLRDAGAITVATIEAAWSTEVGAARFRTFREVLAELAAGAEPTPAP